MVCNLDAGTHPPNTEWLSSPLTFEQQILPEPQTLHVSFVEQVVVVFFEISTVLKLVFPLVMQVSKVQDLVISRKDIQ